ncbi:type II secretion system protein GspC, partial [Thermodesulfobacteriota bacterium]
ALLSWEVLARVQGKQVSPKLMVRKQTDPSINKPATVYSNSISAPLFGEKKIKVVPAVPQRQQERIPTTTLSLVLRGVIGATPQERALAIINSKGGKAEDGIYGIGDTVPGNARVKEIHHDRVILSRSGKLETLLLEADAEIRPEQRSSMARRSSRRQGLGGVVGRGDGVHWSIDRSYLQKQLENIPALAKEVGLDVYKRGNVQKGYRLVSAKGSPLLKSMGLKAGDALLEVNGIKLVDAHRGLTAYQKMRSASEIRLVIERNGIRKDMIYSIGQ